MELFANPIAAITALSVIPGRDESREPGIHLIAARAGGWIPGSRYARPGMTGGGCRFGPNFWGVGYAFG
jgi:hypothetical protein